MRFFLSIVVLGSMSYFYAGTSYGEPVSSPPLRALGFRRLSFSLPNKWKVLHSDSAVKWKTANYSLELIEQNKRHHKITVEVLNHGLDRARRHNDFTGQSFWTKTRIYGVLKHGDIDSNQTQWYFSIPIHKTNQALILRVIGSKSDEILYITAHELFSSVAFDFEK